MRKALYIAIFLHFLRKLLGKVMESPRELPADFPGFAPGEPVRLDVILSLADGSMEIYGGLDQFPKDATRDYAYETIRCLNAMEPKDIFGRVTNVKSAVFSLVHGRLCKSEYSQFKLRYGLGVFKRIHAQVVQGNFDPSRYERGLYRTAETE